MIYGGILDANKPALGFPISDVYTNWQGMPQADFERGRIVWSPYAGAIVTYY